MAVPIVYFLLLFLFIGTQLYLWRVWQKRDEEIFELNDKELPQVTVLIPVRNEEKNIGSCLRSVVLQNYQENLLEIIVINDHSTDRTGQVLINFPEVQLINQPDHLHGKKAALQAGVEMAAGEIILTLDGDCVVGENWVISMVRMIEENSDTLITGPVWMVPEKLLFLQKYQEIEQAALNVLTFSGLQSGLILSASGANMAYHRMLFLELDPYAENQYVPSGDDVFFVQKVHQAGKKVRFEREQEAMVFTNPVATFSGFIRQRLRWAGKSSGYTHWPTRLYLTGFAALNLAFVLLLIAGYWHPIFYSYLFYGLLLKFIVDYLIVHAGMRWGNRQVCWQDVLKASLFQVVYVVYVVVLFVLGKKAGWKN